MNTILEMKENPTSKLPMTSTTTRTTFDTRDGKVNAIVGFCYYLKASKKLHFKNNFSTFKVLLKK